MTIWSSNFVHICLAACFLTACGETDRFLLGTNSEAPAQEIATSAASEVKPPAGFCAVPNMPVDGSHVMRACDDNSALPGAVLIARIEKAEDDTLRPELVAGSAETSLSATQRANRISVKLRGTPPQDRFSQIYWRGVTNLRDNEQLWVALYQPERANFNDRVAQNIIFSTLSRNRRLGLQAKK